MKLTQECAELLERWPMAAQFDLGKRSQIAVVGAYKGLLMSLLDELYAPRRIVGYEPQMWAWTQATARNGKHVVRPYGISAGRNEIATIGEFGTDAASFVNVGPHAREHGPGLLIDASHALGGDFADSDIDLMIMNCEGGEWELLPYLKATGWLPKIKRLALQIHTYGKYDPNTLRAVMADTHSVVVDNAPAWVYWRATV